MNLQGFEDSDDAPDTKLKINKDFAKHYDKSRRSEELMKCKSDDEMIEILCVPD